MDDDPLNIGLRLLGVAFLVLVNGFFVASEFALATVRRTRIEQLVREGHRGASAVQRGLNHLEDFVAAAQLGITMASLGLGWLAEPALAALFLPVFQGLGAWSAAAAHSLAIAVAFTLVTTLHIVVGEQSPKILALHHPERTALWVAAPTELFLVLFKPFIRLLSQASSGLVRLLRVAPRDAISTVHSEEEIKMLLAAREEAGLLDPIEKEMIGRIFSCCDLVAGQVMVPRTEAVCVPHDSRLKDLLVVAAQEGFDRFPVFRENLDDIVGVVHVRELLAAIQGPNPKSCLDRPIASLIRPITSVPHSLPVAQLLARMRQEGARMVLILDEYGGTDGIATWGSILERIVGEMHDVVEAQEPPDIEGLPDGSYRLSGLLLTEEVGEHLGVSIEDPHNDTIGGVVFSRLGRKPEVGDTVEVEGFHFRVEALDGLRIDRLVVLPPSGFGLHPEPTSVAVAG